MSQSGVYGTNVLPPAGPVETLTGNTGGAVPPTAGNINILGSGTLTVAGNPGTSTLTISDQGTFTTTVTTANATITPFPTSIPVASLSAVVIDAEIVGAKSDFSASLAGYIIAGARNSGAGAVIVGSPEINFQEDSASTPSISIQASGATIQITVAGVAAETWKWTAYVRYTTQT